MANVSELIRYFTEGVESPEPRRIGMEVETSFLDENEIPISEATSQRIFVSLAESGLARIVGTRDGKVAELRGTDGMRYLYELGRQNIELASVPDHDAGRLLGSVRAGLGNLYRIAGKYGAYPLYAPILETEEDLLMVPDERDETWLRLDGRRALRRLATISAVQFTIDIDPDEAVTVLNRLGGSIGDFLADYPQDAVWRAYVRESLAGYRSDRYGGSLRFDSLEQYCEQLAMHDVVSNGTLVPYRSCRCVDIPLYLRSIWWYFRLKRYGDRLCIEVRPIPRRSDAMLERQLAFVIEALGL